MDKLIEKFKEKKANVVEALRGALDAVYASVSGLVTSPSKMASDKHCRLASPM